MFDDWVQNLRTPSSSCKQVDTFLQDSQTYKSRNISYAVVFKHILYIERILHNAHILVY